METNEKKIVHKIEEGMNPQDVLCTTYQMRNFYSQFRDGFFSNLDVMNYIQHFRAAQLAKKGMNVVDVCCGRSLMLPLLRYYAKDINSYTGVDICEANIKEAKRGASAKVLKEEDLEDYYPFKTQWILSNCAEMSQHIKAGSADFVIYTSAIEHMHKDVGYQSLKECHTIMNRDSFMFLSCPNTPGNGYETQYAAHVYEWGYDELKTALDEIGFEIVQEVGLVLGAKEMEELYRQQSPEIQEFYDKMKAYVPTTWLTAFMAIPYPEQAREVLFIVKKKQKKLF
jgi:SAM-dependent methyltransferase